MPWVVVSGMPQWRAGMDEVIKNLERQTDIAVRLSAGIIEGKAKMSFGPAHARGSPKTSQKPQSQTPGGALRKSIEILNRNQNSSIGLGLYRGQVAPQEIYGRRVELGFYDMTDSLGRHYFQPPYPFLHPGFLKAIPEIDTLLTARWSAALRLA